MEGTGESCELYRLSCVHTVTPVQCQGDSLNFQFLFLNQLDLFLTEGVSRSAGLGSCLGLSRRGSLSPSWPAPPLHPAPADSKPWARPRQPWSLRTLGLMRRKAHSGVSMCLACGTEVWDQWAGCSGMEKSLWQWPRETASIQTGSGQGERAGVGKVRDKAVRGRQLAGHIGWTGVCHPRREGAGFKTGTRRCSRGS